MNVTVEEVNPLTRRLRIVLPVEDVAKELDTAYRKLKSEVSMKGFRRGKAPRAILEKAYGERVRAEVGEKLVQATYFDAVEQEKLDPVTHPDITGHEFTADGSFVYQADIDVRPDFELKQYKGLEIEKPEVVVDDSEVEKELERMRKEMAPLRNVDERGVRLHDLVVVDFQGFDNGQAIPQVNGDNVSVDVGSGRNGEEFENQLVGMKTGEEKTFEVSFDAGTPNPVLAGKTVEFKVLVNEIKERVLAELDDEFAKDVGKEFTTLDELKAEIRAKKLQAKEDAQQGDLADRLMLKLLESHEFAVPERLVRYEIEDHLKQTESHLERGGMSFEAVGINREEMGERYREAAEKRVRGDFILKKIAEVEEIKVADEDLNQGFERIAAQYNMTINEVKGYFKSRDDILPFMNEMLNEKILKFLLDQAKYNRVPAAEAEAEQAPEPAAAGDEA
ncbi:MAG: trigger factor [Desulfobacterales bacterium]|nr:trigger factor [Desulfobacterales bacterium]